MYYMFKDIVDTLTAALPLGLLAGVLIFVLKRYAFKIDKQKLYAVCEIAFWAYVYILLYRTVIGREPIYDPLSEVWQGWTIFRRRWTGLDYQVIGNVLMFMPFGALLLLGFEKLSATTKKAIVCTAVVSFGYSLFIEILQLVTKRGTFQISDLVFNTVGGTVGAIIYIIIKRIIKKKRSSE